MQEKLSPLQSLSRFTFHNVSVCFFLQLNCVVLKFLRFLFYFKFIYICRKFGEAIVRQGKWL